MMSMVRSVWLVSIPINARIARIVLNVHIATIAPIANFLSFSLSATTVKTAWDASICRQLDIAY